MPTTYVIDDTNAVSNIKNFCDTSVCKSIRYGEIDLPLNFANKEFSESQCLTEGIANCTFVGQDLSNIRNKIGSFRSSFSNNVLNISDTLIQIQKEVPVCKVTKEGRNQFRVINRDTNLSSNDIAQWLGAECSSNVELCEADSFECGFLTIDNEISMNEKSTQNDRYDRFYRRDDNITDIMNQNSSLSNILRDGELVFTKDERVWKIEYD